MSVPTGAAVDAAVTPLVCCAFAAALMSWQGELPLQLPAGASVADALASAMALLTDRGIGLSAEERAWWSAAPVGIFGEVCARDRLLEPGDRVELYRPLRVDPKSARRARAQQTQTEKGRNPLTVKPTRQVGSR